MSVYKFVQFVKNNINQNEIFSPIVIFLQTTETWLNKLKFKDKNIPKVIFIDRHEQSDLMSNCMDFLKAIEKFIYSIIHFQKDNAIKTMLIYLI